MTDGAVPAELDLADDAELVDLQQQSEALSVQHLPPASRDEIQHQVVHASDCRRPREYGDRVVDDDLPALLLVGRDGLQQLGATLLSRQGFIGRARTPTRTHVRTLRRNITHREDVTSHVRPPHGGVETMSQSLSLESSGEAAVSRGEERQAF